MAAPILPLSQIARYLLGPPRVERLPETVRDGEPVHEGFENPDSLA
jgi:hypothetical protein